MISGRKPAAIFIFAALLVAAAAAQDAPATFGETVDVELVNVEVWVTDNKDNAVTGLTAADFEVREDGARSEPMTVKDARAHNPDAFARFLRLIDAVLTDEKQRLADQLELGLPEEN